VSSRNEALIRSIEGALAGAFLGAFFGCGCGIGGGLDQNEVDWGGILALAVNMAGIPIGAIVGTWWGYRRWVREMRDNASETDSVAEP
jgi:hypothetical protein